MSQKRPTRKKHASVLPSWLSGFSDDDATEATAVAAKYIRLLMCDSAGLRRCRVIPAARLKTVAEDGLGMTRACMGQMVFSDTYAPDSGLDATGEIRLMPDLNSRVPCAWHMQHEMCMVDLCTTPGVPWSCCPRTTLRRVVADVEEAFGLQFSVGHEVEFYLLRAPLLDEPSKNALPEPVDTSIYSQSTALDNVASVMDDIVECLDSCGIEVDQLHAEAGPGQFEVAVRHGPVLQVADDILYIREAIANIAARHALVASFVPKPFSEGSGSGAHLHLSMTHVSDGSDNLLGHVLDGLSGEEGTRGESFMAGILQHLPGLCLFTLPSPLSYERIKPGAWAGAYSVWGVNNREAPIRFCPGMKSSGSNVEIKCVDNTVNPYIALAALIVAGVEGIRGTQRLPAACHGNPAADANAKMLPKNLGEAIEAYEADAELRKALEAGLGLELLQAFVSVRKLEARTAKSIGSYAEQNKILYMRY